MKSKKFKLTLICANLVLYLSSGLFAFGSAEIADNGKKNVAVTFDAMYELTKAVAKDKVNISVIIPEGMEPHNFEPRAKDLAFLAKADVLVYNGLNMEFWLDEALNAVKNKNLIKVEASYGIKPIRADQHHNKHKHHNKHHHHQGEFDPHAWLGLSSAKIMVQNIADALCKADSANKTFYQTNAKNYIAELDTLLKEYQSKFKNIKHRHFVTGHAAFAYLCRDLNLDQDAVRGVFCEGEANARDLAHLVDYCRTHHIKTVFTEHAASPEVSKTLAGEVNANIAEIYTIGTPKDKKTYLERMKINLERLYENLK